jgi:hypothetical protein
MRNIITVLTLLVIFLCDLPGQNISDNNYLVKKIKSKKGWYIIYAVKNDSIFKIVSQKDKPSQECNKILVGQYYDFYLESTIPVINGVKMLPINYLDFKTPFTDKKSVFSIEPKKGIFDSYQAKNLKGLCLIESL